MAASWDVETLYLVWDLTKKGVIIFHDTASDQQVAVERELIRQFIAAGRHTDTRYRVSIVGGHSYGAIEAMGYSAGFHPRPTGNPPTAHTITHGLRLEYQRPGLKGYAVFAHLVNKGKEATAKQAKAWASDPTMVYI